MRIPLAIACALAALVMGEAAIAQMKGTSPAEVAGIARARALDYRLNSISPVPSPQPLVRGMIVSREVAPDAVIGIGFSNLYGRKKESGESRINGGPRRGKKPAVTFSMRF